MMNGYILFTALVFASSSFICIFFAVLNKIQDIISKTSKLNKDSGFRNFFALLRENELEPKRLEAQNALKVIVFFAVIALFEYICIDGKARIINLIIGYSVTRAVTALFNSKAIKKAINLLLCPIYLVLCIPIIFIGSLKGKVEIKCNSKAL